MTIEAIIISTTTDSEEIARHLAKRSIDLNLAACAQIIPGIISTYSWEDQIETSSEIIIQFKTRFDLSAQLMAMLRQEHNYETPEILQIRIDQMDPDYEKWLTSVTARHLS